MAAMKAPSTGNAAGGTLPAKAELNGQAASEQILHYEVRGKLGEGGMGVVYKAVDRKLNRLVALKFLPPHIDPSDVSLERFLQEANALSALNHPHIATIYTLEADGERQFLVLEYLPGGTLKAKLQQARNLGTSLSTEDILKYAQQTAEGLAHAHARGIIHRDVKTSNLMLTEEGDVKVTDFGVAKLTGSSLRTLPGSLMGTIAYMSTEQVLGMEVDARSDAFSFGVALFELISGRLPFEAPNDAALLTKIANARVPELKAFRPDVPETLENIVARALKKRPEDRYESMIELVADIRAARGVSFDSTRERTRRRVSPLVGSERARRRRAVAVAVVSALLVPFAFRDTRQLVHSWWTELFSQTKPPQPKIAVAKAKANRLGVRPFRSLIEEPQIKAFAESLAGELAQRLSQFGQFQNSLSLDVDATNDDVTLLLTGSVIQQKESIILVANLLDAQKRMVLNSIDFETPTEARSSLHQSLANKVAEILQLQLLEVPGVHELYLRGRGYLDRYDRLENVEHAIGAFEKALSVDATHVLANAGRAEAYLRKYRLTKDKTALDRAGESVTAAVQSKSQLAPVNFAIGLYREATGDQRGAIESFEQSLAMEPTADATRELANAYDAANQLELAEATYRRAIELRKGHWLEYKQLGVFYQKHGRFKEALPLFRLVAQLNPDDHSSYTNLGGMYIKLHKYPEAIAILQKAVEIDPNPLAYHALGTSLYLDHRYREAIDSHRAATRLNPTEGDHWGALGDAYRMVPGMLDSAIGAYQQAVLLKEEELKIRRADASLRAQIASWCTLTNRRRALSEIREAIRLSPRDPRVQATAATVYEQLQMRDQAIAAVEKAVKLGYAVSELQDWPPLERLRLDPRYTRIIESATEGASVPIIRK